MKRVLFVTRCFPPAQGGMERFAKDMHDALQPKVKLFSLRWGGSKSALLFVLPYFFIRSMWYLSTRKIDVIHAQDGVVSIMLNPLAKLFRKPLVVVIHGLDVTYKLRLFQVLIRWSLSHATQVVCISEAAQKEVISRGVTAGKTQVIPIGVTDDVFSGDQETARKSVYDAIPDAQDKKIILSSGRLVERKGMEWFVTQVMPLVLSKQPDTILLVSGEGPWRANIESAIEAAGLQGSVRLLGRTTDVLLHNLYNAADCFVMPNIPVVGDMEGFGRVLIEAALCEVPVVASGIEGIRDAITDGKNGTLVPAKDAAAHAQAILKVLRDTTHSHTAGARARKYSLATFGWEHISELYLAVYNNVGHEV